MRSHPSVSSVDRMPRKIGHPLAVGKIWLRFGQIWPISAEFEPMCSPNSAGVRRILADVGQIWSKYDQAPNWDRFRSYFFGESSGTLICMARSCLHLFRPESESWVEWQTRTWREGRAQLTFCWGATPFAVVAASAVVAISRLASSPACSVVGRCLLGRSAADMEALAITQQGRGRERARRKIGRPQQRWEEPFRQPCLLVHWRGGLEAQAGSHRDGARRPGRLGWDPTGLGRAAVLAAGCRFPL